MIFKLILCHLRYVILRIFSVLLSVVILSRSLS